MHENNNFNSNDIDIKYNAHSNDHDHNNGGYDDKTYSCEKVIKMSPFGRFPPYDNAKADRWIFMVFLWLSILLAGLIVGLTDAQSAWIFLYVVIAFCCSCNVCVFKPTLGRYWRHYFNTHDEMIDYVNEMRDAHPTILWHAVCYHISGIEHTKNKEIKERTEVTHVAIARYIYGQCVDVTKIEDISVKSKIHSNTDSSINININDENIMNIIHDEGVPASVSRKIGDENHGEMQAAKVKKCNDNTVTNNKYPVMTQLSLRACATIDFANEKLTKDYMQKFEQFKKENKKDTHQDYHEFVAVENLHEYVMAPQPNISADDPGLKYRSKCIYRIAWLLGIAPLYECWFNKRSVHQEIVFKKRIIA